MKSKYGGTSIAGLVFLLKTFFFLIVSILTIAEFASADLIEEWVARYNGSNSVKDVAYAIAVDAAGNVYATGENNGNYVTIKYDRSGNELWAARYNGPGNGMDSAVAIAVDAEGNAYVTGSSLGSGTDFDYATIKYNRDGNQLWMLRYNGNDNKRDFASAIAVNDLGNVYVTGSENNSWFPDQFFSDPSPRWEPGFWVFGDHATVKYDRDGNRLWVASYNGKYGCDHASALALDAASNVYVTGFTIRCGPVTGTSSDYATVKYDANGNELWAAVFNGSGGHLDYPFGLAVDPTGNVYVTGSSDAWLRADFASEPPFRFRVSGGYATVKYDTNGNELWIANHSGPGIQRKSTVALAVDSIGDVYVSGAGGEPGTSSNYAIVHYDTNGNELEMYGYNGPAQGSDTPWALAVDSSGSVYVTGSSQGEISMDYVTLKLRSGNGASDSDGGGGGSGISANLRLDSLRGKIL
jgi:hypothetical protein